MVKLKIKVKKKPAPKKMKIKVKKKAPKKIKLKIKKPSEKTKTVSSYTIKNLLDTPYKKNETVFTFMDEQERESGRFSMRELMNDSYSNTIRKELRATIKKWKTKNKGKKMTLKQAQNSVVKEYNMT